MAKLKMASWSQDYRFIYSYYEGAPERTSVKTSTDAVFLDSIDDNFVRIEGKGLQYHSDGGLKGGSISKVVFTDGQGEVFATASHLKASAETFYDLYVDKGMTKALGYLFRGDDKLYAVATDGLAGFDGNDKLYGSDYDDTLSGGRGNDILKGGNAWDDMDGGPGRDILWGGLSRDTFHFSQGQDKVMDFEDGMDVLQDIGDYHLTRKGDDTVVTADDTGWSLLLVDIRPNQITDADFA